MKNELFTIGSLTVYGYGFMIATGVLAAWIVTEYRAKKQNLDSEHVFSLVLWCLMGGLSLQSFCSGSQNGKALQKIRDFSLTRWQMDLWYMAELSVVFWQAGCIAGSKKHISGNILTL